METDWKNRRKPERFNLPGHVHELTFSCFKRKPFLNSSKAKEYLTESIIKAKEEHSFFVWAYVFMPEHIHLLIKPRNDEYAISKILHSIKQPVSRKVFNFFRTHSPTKLNQFSTGQIRRPFRFWLPGGGYDRNIVSPNVARAVIDYIHNNPVRRQLVENPVDWKWSSFGDWENLSEGPIPIDKGTVDLF